MPYPAQINVEELGQQALALAEDKGWENWSLRDVARQLGVTANALYRYVEDRDGLAALMGEAATRELHAYLRKNESRYSNMAPVAVLQNLATRYMQFARTRPDAYSAFFHGKPAPGDPAISAWLDFWIWLHAKVSAAVPGAEDATAFTLWAFLHGRVELERGPAQLAANDAGLNDAITALVAGFQGIAPLRSPLPKHIRSLTE